MGDFNTTLDPYLDQSNNIIPSKFLNHFPTYIFQTYGGLQTLLQGLFTLLPSTKIIM